MKVIPLIATPSQVIQTSIDNNDYTIEVTQKSTGLYFSLGLNNQTVVYNVICRDATMLLTNYKPWGINFAFIDTQGSSDPYYTGLGTRFLLLTGPVVVNDQSSDAQPVVFK